MNFKFNLVSTLKEYKRILKITRKPSKEEFFKILKISTIGMLVIGFIGFAIQIIWQLFQGLA